MKWTAHGFDVVVVGGGAAGALAAIAARKAGASVALLTKESSLVGGATIMAAGGTSASLSPGDSPGTFLKDILKAGADLNNPVLARMVAEGSVGALFGLETYGFLLDRQDASTLRTIKHGEGHSFPRGYLDRREALGFCHGIAKAAMHNGVTVFPETVALSLLKRNNQATGVLGWRLVSGEYAAFGAKAVVLASGGLGALYEVTTNSSVLTGDGYAMAWDSGAELIDMEMVQFIPLAFPYPRTRRGKIIGMCSHFGPGVKLFNGLGERYMVKYDPERLEFATRDTGARANYTEILEGRGTKNHAIVVDPREHDPNIWLRWQTSLPHHYAMFRQVFGEEAAKWEAPFEAMPSQHFFMGGVRIDDQCRTGVPGLFAGGEIAGGVHGANRLSGTALTEAFLFGPLAGKKASSFAAAETAIPLDTAGTEEAVKALERSVSRQTGTGARPFELKEAIQSAMWHNLGPVRTGEKIRGAVAALESIRTNDLPFMVTKGGETRYNRERMEALETSMMLTTALLVANSALTRTESRGSHYRADFPSRDDSAWLKNVALRKNEDGSIDQRLTEIG